MVKPLRKSPNKNPPIFSHEFVIQNHGDIVPCIVMVFIAGFMVQATAPLATTFILLNHNVTDHQDEVPLYLPGFKDTAAIFFYSLICIIFHAVLQEYVIDKILKKLHLSKSKLAIFTTSGQLCAFYLVSIVWGIDIVIKEYLVPDFTKIWSEYPAPMTFLFKLYLITQFAYGLHEIPELYFQRVKKDEWPAKIATTVFSIILVAVPYVLNFNRLLVLLLLFHHVAELVNHASQLLQTIDKDDKFTETSRLTTSAVRIISCLCSIILSVLSLWYGFALHDNQQLDIENQRFNIPQIRFVLLAGIIILQTYFIFQVFGQEISKRNTSSSSGSSATNLSKSKSHQKNKSKAKKPKKTEESDLPEVDQNTNKTLRKQKVK